MESIKFAVFTDLHYDHIHDGHDRLNYFLEKASGPDIDFIVNLGDFCKPVQANQKLLDRMNLLEKPVYHAIGNHDTDYNTKREAISFLGLENSYYSFTKDFVKFIVLDACFIEKSGVCESYSKDNMKDSGGNYPVIPQAEIEWLKSQFADSYRYYVILSHHSLENDFKKRGIFNKKEIQDIINEQSDKGKTVLLCINGHDHGDSIQKIENTCYFGLNAMSYIWFGPLSNQTLYSEKLYSQYPGLKEILLYDEGLHATVTIHENGSFQIEGMTSDYQKMSPAALGIYGNWNGRIISPNVSSYREEGESK